MTYQDGAFCEKLEAIRRRLSDLRAVLDSGFYSQVESTHINNSNRAYHHKSSHGKHSHHHKSYKTNKSHHHHKHAQHECLHQINLKSTKKKSSRKKYYTDKIGRRLYARAIPIEKDYLLSNVEIARLMKKKKVKSDLNSNEIPKKQKTPLLFPFEEINLKNSDVSSSFDYDDIYSEYEYSDYDDNGYYEDVNDDKYAAANQGASSRSNKKQIIYLKTYQTQEKSKESKNCPTTYQEKGKIVYFDAQNTSSDENPNFFINEMEKNDINRVQKQRKNQARKDKNSSHKLDPIVPISNNNKEVKLTQNKKIKKSKINIKDDENLVIQERKVDINYEIIQSNNIKENDELFNPQNSKKKKVRKQSINSEISNKIQTNLQTKNEIRPKDKRNQHQNKSIQSKNKKINHNQLSDKNSNKYDMSKYFTFTMCIKNQPVCIAIGDIEGDIKKLGHIYNLIKANPSLNFVFIGDLIDDISDASPLSKENWRCLSLLSEFFVGKSKFSFKTDDNKNIDIISNGPPVSLPSAFNDIRFGKNDFDKIRSRVKFIVGNAEYVTLSDIREGCEIIRGDETKYVFGKGKWKKTVSFEQLCLLYRYFKSCYGIIELKRPRPDFASKNGKFVDTVYFRHSPSTFEDPNDIVSQVPDLNESDVKKGNFIFVTGHCRKFVNGESRNPEGQAFIIDDSSPKYNRLAVISFDNNSGFSVEAFALPGEFPKSE